MRDPYLLKYIPMPQDFDFWFFMNQFPPSPWVLRFFRKFAEIFAAQGSPPVSLTPVANEKIFNQKNFNNFVGTPLDSRVNKYINFCLQVHFKVSADWHCSHCLPAASLIPTTILPPVSLILVANLPPVSLITVVHLDLRVSPWIFEKMWNGPNGILWGWGETDLWKQPEAKNLVTLSL